AGAALTAAEAHRVRAATELPVAVGFGISRPEQIRSLRGLAEGVVIGSRIVSAIRNGEDLGGTIEDLKRATRLEGPH
ncbi:MAG TPA: tryptophan synthase subunit alpha, partial [Phycisphaerae bacterium]|nr:tryptophan synthase subunit alpha [Phycisphaerae bacterium]